MKFFLLALCINFGCILNGLAQNIIFQKRAVPIFTNKEPVHAKPVLIFIDGPAPVENLMLKMRDHFLENAEVGKVYNQNFISYKVDFGSKEFEGLLNTFKPNGFPLFVFLNQNGAEISRQTGYLTSPHSYIKLADTILNKLNNKSYLGVYEKRYLSGERSREFLRTYIEARMQSGIFDNADLIDEYLQFLTLGEINSFNEMLFILRAGPLIGSRAMSLSFMNNGLRDSIYKTIPQYLAKEINRVTIENSFKRAVEKKDRDFAYQIGNYVAGTYTDVSSGSRAQNGKIIDFYKAIKDTASFLREVSYLIDREYMRISIDSARKTLPQRPGLATTSLPGGETSGFRLVALPVYQNSTSVALNNAAWDIYVTGTRNENYLYKALSWVRRSLEIEPAAYNYDTYAHLLYTLGLRAEAVNQQTKALNMAKKSEPNKAFFEKLQSDLNKMKAGTL